MKKILSIIALFLFLFTLAGCNDDEQEVGDSNLFSTEVLVEVTESHNIYLNKKTLVLRVEYLETGEGEVRSTQTYYIATVERKDNITVYYYDSGSWRYRVVHDPDKTVVDEEYQVYRTD